MTLTAEQDPLGKALIDFYQGKKEEPVLVRSDTAQDDLLPPSLFFGPGKKCQPGNKWP